MEWGKIVNMTRYADNKAVDESSRLQEMMNRLNTVAKEYAYEKL